MAKQKFDLTSDLIDITPEIQEANKQETKNTVVEEKAEQVFLTIAVDSETRAEFKAWCAVNKLKMKEAFIESFKLLKEKYQS